MKPTIRNISILFVLSLIMGCERDLDLSKYRDPETEKMLVVNSILNPDSVIAVSVTNPYFFSQQHLSFQPVLGLDVSISRESGIWETLKYDSISKTYKSQSKPQADEILNLKVSGHSQSAFSCDSIPRKVEIEDIQVKGEGPMHIYWDKDYKFTYKITFHDTPGRENYYFLSVKEDYSGNEFSQMGQIDYSQDYVFQILANIINSEMQGWQPDGGFGYPFSDYGIDGDTYTITVTETLQNPWTEMIKKLPRKINLYAISKAYYDYMLSVIALDYDESSLKGDLLSIGLIEPTPIFSNINGGTGIMGSYSLFTKRIDLLEITGGWPKP